MIALLLTFALLLAANLWGVPSLWGMDALGRLSTVGTLVGFGLVGITALPAVSSNLLLVVTRLTKPIFEGPKWSVVLFGAGLIAIYLAMAAGPLSTATDLLGDGQLIVESLERAAAGDDASSMRRPAAAFRETLTAPLTASAMALAAKSASPRVAAEAVSIGSGVLYLVLLLIMLRVLCLDAASRVLLLVVGVFGASNQLFLGYVENYTLLQSIALAYALSVHTAAKGRAPVLLPVLLLVLALVAHVQAVLLVPSLIALLLSRWRVAYLFQLTRLRVLVPVCAIFTVLLSLTFEEHVLGFTGYALVSFDHLIDVVNISMLVFPLGIWLVVMLVRNRPDSEPKAPHFGDALDRSLNLALLTPGILYLLIIDPTLGMARDWDRFTFLLVPLLFSLAIVIGPLFRGSKRETIEREIVFASAIVALVGIGWFTLNASQARSVERVEEIVRADVKSQSHGYEALGVYWDRRGESARAAIHYESAYEVNSNPRLAVLSAQSLLQLQRSDDAALILDRALRRRPGDHRVRHELLRIVGQNGDWPHALELARDGTESHPSEAIYWFYAGESMRRMGEAPQAIRYFERCLEFEMPSANRQHVVDMLEQLKESR